MTSPTLQALEEQVARLAKSHIIGAVLDAATETPARTDKRATDCARSIITLITETGLAAPEGWRPIESAPKNGTPVDLWVLWACGSRVEAQRATGARWRDGFWHANGIQLSPCSGIVPNITHWQPLPAAPLPATLSEGKEDG